MEANTDPGFEQRNRHQRRAIAAGADLNKGGANPNQFDPQEFIPPHAGTGVLLLTVEDAARQLHTSRTVLYAAIQKNLIRSVKIGRSRRLHIEEVRRIAEQGLDTGVRA